MQRDFPNDQNINFVGVGLQKCGTSWLYKRLDELDEFWLPPRKELHYFNIDRHSAKDKKTFYKKSISLKTIRKANTYDTISLLKRPGLIARLFVYSLYRAFFDKNINHLQWYLRYYFQKPSDSWYLSLFNGGAGKIKGEITPAYSILSDDEIAHLKKVIQDGKIILMIRNPIDRAWSHCRFKTNLDLNDTNKVIQFIESYEQTSRSDILNIIDRFRRHFEGQLMVGFYDAIIDQPFALLEEIVAFLGGNPEMVRKDCRVGQKQNVSRKEKIPQTIKNYLSTKYLPMVEELSQEYGGYFTKYLETAKGIPLSENQYPATLIL